MKFKFVLTEMGWFLRADDVEMLTQYCLNGLRLKNQYIPAVMKHGFIDIVDSEAGIFSTYKPKVYGVCYKDNLDYPKFTEADISVKTWKPIDTRNNYAYHYYVTLGGVELHEGDKRKFNSETEAYEFARRFVNK